MALVLKDRVKETATSPGTGTVTLQGAVTGFSSFSVIGNGNTTFYTIADQSGNNWEVGIGTYTSSGTTLSRDTVLSNSLGTTALINFATGIQDVFVTYPAERSAYVDGTALVPSNSGQLPISTGVSGLGTGVASALGTNVGTAGSVVVNGGALGTPSSGNLTNVTIPLANVTGAGTMAAQNATSVAITGGAIDGTTVGATTRSQVYATYIGLIETATGGAVTLSGTSGGQVAIGRTDNVASTPTLQFNSAATSSDFDVSMEASGGTGTPGQGTLNIAAGSVQVNSTPVVTTTSTQTLTNKTLTDPVILNTTTLRGAGVSSYTPFVQTFSAAKTNFNGYQLNYIQNANNGSDASVDYVAYNDASDVDSYFVDMGITSSNYTNALNTVFPANSGYVYTGGGTSGQAAPLVLGTSNPASDLVLFTGGTLTTDTRMTVKGNTGHILINTTTDTGETLQVNGDATISGDVVFGGTVTLDANPTTALEAATKQYVDNQVTAGIHIHEPVRVETTGNLTATYVQGGTTFNITAITGGDTVTTSVNHGLVVGDQIWLYTTAGNGLSTNTAYFVFSVPASNQLTLSLEFGGVEITGLTNATGLTFATRANSGIGATLTNAGTQAALEVDGITLSVADRVMVRLQTLGEHNGVYVVTNTGSGSTNWILTRSVDQSFISPADPDGLGTGDYFFTREGLLNAGDSHVLTTEPNTMIIGYTPLTYTQFSGSVDYVGGTNITVTGQTINVSGTIAATLGGTGTSTVTTGDLLYGSAANTWSKLPVGTAYKTLSVNAAGTQVEWNAVALNQATAVSGQLGAANGGTGLSSLGTGVPTALGINVGTAGSFITNGGALGTPSSGTLTNATGLPISTGVSGLGTGVTTALATNVGTGGSFITNGGALGTPSSGTLTNATGLPLTTGVTGTLPVANGGTGVTAAGGAAIGNVSGVTLYTTTATVNMLSTTAALNVFDLNTVSGTFVNLPDLSTISAGFSVTIFNRNVQGGPVTVRTFASGTFVNAVNKFQTAQFIYRGSGTGSSAWVVNYIGALDATGNGNLVYSTSPTLVSPALGIPTSVGLANATGLPLTTGVTGTLPVTNGGTGQTSYTDGQLLIGNSTGNTLTPATLTAGSGISITNGSGAITITATAATAVTSVTGTAPVVSSGGTTPAISLASDYGDTQNPYASKTANFVLAAPNGTAGVPTFRAVVAADIPTLNQNTTGTAGNVTGIVALANGGTGQTSQQAAINSLAGAVTSGQYLRGNGTNVVMSAIQAADVPTLNQNTTGSAATLTTTRTIYGNNFNGSANVTGVIGASFGGTGNGFTAFTGPTTSTKTFTLPDASSTIVVQGGALGTPTSGNVGACTIDGTNLAGYRGVPFNIQVNTNYTTVLADAGKAIIRGNAADATVRTFTLAGSGDTPAVFYVVGTVISFINYSGTNLLIAAGVGGQITLANSLTTGTRTLARNGLATAIFTGADTWLISGVGLT